MIIYFDTETTGLYPGNICQLSYVMQDRKVTVAKNMFFTVDYVETGAQMVHGLSVPKLKILSNGKRFGDCIDEIEKDFSRADILVAHNISFDLMFMRKEFEINGRVFLYNNGFCSMKKSTPVCKLKRKSGGYKYPKLSELCEYFGISDLTIMEKTQELFSESTYFHDARFDTTAVYLAMNKGIDCESELRVLENYL